MADYLSDKENLSDLIGQMSIEEQQRYEGCGHLRLEAAFIGRVFVAYKVQEGQTIQILDYIKVTDFNVDRHQGAVATLQGVQGDKATVGHTPSRIFDLPVFVCVPPQFQFRWDARKVDGVILRSLSFPLLVKAKNRAEFRNVGNTYLEVPNKVAKLFPQIADKIAF